MSTAGVGSAPQALRYSIVVPTYQRREILIGSLRSLGALDDLGFEVIVVVDGSTDGTADALARLEFPFPLRVIEQNNSGAARARNVGAAAARAELVLFLDDDMRADPHLLAAHERAYADGADAVLGHIPVSPDAPRTFLTPGLDEWAESRRRRLVDGGGQLDLSDLLTGQLSVRRQVFRDLGGFDEQFTRGGSFGNEDTDFGRRLLDGGYRVVFAPDAISWQYYDVAPSAYLQQWHDAGRADVAYMRKYPDAGEEIFRARRATNRSNRFVIRPLARTPVLSGPVAALARTAAVRLARTRPDDQRASRFFFRVRNLEYWRGVNAAGGRPASRPFAVLCYHSISDLAGAGFIEPYGVPEQQFRRQLRLLRRVGYRFLTPGEAVRAVAGGGGTPRRGVLLTFDDCFADLLTAGAPVLADAQVPVAAFAVADLVGGTNEWDTRIGAPELRLLDADQLRALQDYGVDIGVHGSTHRPLSGVDAEVLQHEVHDAVRTLSGLGLRPPRAFAYPHGANDAAARAAVAGAGLDAAFTVDPGVVRPGATDPYAVPRIEIVRADGAGLRFIAKVALAGSAPRTWDAVRRLRRFARRAGRRAGVRMRG